MGSLLGDAVRHLDADQLQGLMRNALESLPDQGKQELLKRHIKSALTDLEMNDLRQLLFRQIIEDVPYRHGPSLAIAIFEHLKDPIVDNLDLLNLDTAPLYETWIKQVIEIFLQGSDPNDTDFPVAGEDPSSSSSPEQWKRLSGSGSYILDKEDFTHEFSNPFNVSKGQFDFHYNGSQMYDDQKDAVWVHQDRFWRRDVNKVKWLTIWPFVRALVDGLAHAHEDSSYGMLFGVVEDTIYKLPLTDEQKRSIGEQATALESQ